jgi:hypothetical protein
MTASAATQKHDFIGLLAASGRSPEIPEENDVYGWLVGSWDLEALHYAAVDVAPLRIQGEVHFGWVLEGRTIQDVWIMPRVSERNANLAKTNNTYGTTLRIWDASIQAWRIRWINPVTNHCEQQTGRRVGPRKDDDIVQVGARIDGTPTRWRFTEITQDSFHWIGESLNADGATWKLEGEFRCKRMR